MNSITKKEVMDYINKKGFKRSLSGYYYIIEAILIGLKDTSIIRHGGVTKRLYPDVAKLFNKTPSQTERSIRHAIETSRYGVNSEWKLDGLSEHPTNSEFLCIAVNELTYGGE